MAFVIEWVPWRCFVTARRPNRKPYAQNISDPDVKVWQTRKAAERWLKLKDPTWAASCAIRERP